MQTRRSKGKGEIIFAGRNWMQGSVFRNRIDFDNRKHPHSALGAGHRFWFIGKEMK